MPYKNSLILLLNRPSASIRLLFRRSFCSLLIKFKKFQEFQEDSILTTAARSFMKLLICLSAAFLLVSQSQAQTIPLDMANGMTAEQAATAAAARGEGLNEIAEALYNQGQSVDQVTQALLSTGADANAVASTLVATQSTAPTAINNQTISNSLNAAGVTNTAPVIAFIVNNPPAIRPPSLRAPAIGGGLGGGVGGGLGGGGIAGGFGGVGGTGGGGAGGGAGGAGGGGSPIPQPNSPIIFL